MLKKCNVEVEVVVVVEEEEEEEEEEAAAVVVAVYRHLIHFRLSKVVLPSSKILLTPLLHAGFVITLVCLPVRLWVNVTTGDNTGRS